MGAPQYRSKILSTARIMMGSGVNPCRGWLVWQSCSPPVKKRITNSHFSSPIDTLSNYTSGMSINSTSPSIAPPAYSTKSMNGSTDSWSTQAPPMPAKSAPEASGGKPKPQCKALYDFEAQNPGELEFKEGALIDLISQVDENWYEGTVNGKTGYFPINYVKVTVPL